MIFNAHFVEIRSVHCAESEVGGLVQSTALRVVMFTTDCSHAFSLKDTNNMQAAVHSV